MFIEFKFHMRTDHFLSIHNVFHERTLLAAIYDFAGTGQMQHTRELFHRQLLHSEYTFEWSQSQLHAFPCSGEVVRRTTCGRIGEYFTAPSSVNQAWILNPLVSQSLLIRLAYQNNNLPVQARRGGQAIGFPSGYPDIA